MQMSKKGKSISKRGTNKPIIDSSEAQETARKVHILAFNILIMQSYWNKDADYSM